MRRVVSIFLLVMIAMMFNADQNLLYPNYLLIMKEFNVTELEIGFLSSVFAFTATLTVVLWGYLTDVVTRKKLLLIGVLTGEIPCFLTAFAQDYWQLLVLRVFTGIGIGSLAPITATLVADVFEESKRGKGYGLMGTAGGLGILLGMIVAGLLPDWRLPFIIVSVPNWILAPLFYIIAPEPRRGESENVLKKLYERGLEYTYRISWKIAKKSLVSKTNILVLLQGALGTLPWGLIVSWLISFFIIVRGMNKEIATLILLILGLTTQFSNIVGGILGDYFDKKIRGGRALFSGISILLGVPISIGFIMYPWPSQLGLFDWILLVAYALLLIQVLSWAGPNVPAIMSHVNLPEHRGTVFAILNLLGNIGGALGPLLGGFIIEYFRSMGYPDVTSYLWTMVIGALFWIPCGLIWFLIHIYYPLDRESTMKILEKRVEELIR